MGIFIERKEETLARLIEDAPQKARSVVMTKEQLDLDFDQQVVGALSLHSERLREAITRCSPYLAERSEQAIITTANPSHVDQLLRVAMWEEISNAIAENREIDEKTIYSGVCSRSYWQSIRDGDEDKFTYLLIPVKSYQKTNKLLLMLGQQALIEILNADPFVKGQGSGNRKQLDPKIAKVQLEAYKMIEERIYGKAVNRLQTHVTTEQVKTGESLEDLQKEIAMLEGKKSAIAITMKDNDE